MKLKFLSIAFAVLALASCKNEPIRPASADVDGDLGECFTVVERDYEPAGEPDNQTLTVDIKRTDAELPFDLSKGEVELFGETPCRANVGFGIELLDEKGGVIGKIDPTDVESKALCDNKEFLDLVNLKPGSTGTLTVKMPKGEKSKAVRAFRVTSAYEEGVGNLHHLAGAINGKYNIHMIFDIKKGRGAYYYDKYSPDHFLILNVESFNPSTGELTLSEYTTDGLNTGNFFGKISLDGYTGAGNFNGKSMSVNLREVDPASAGWPVLESIPAFIEPSFVRAQPSASSGSSNNIDDMLDSYERFVKKYVSLAKKASSGDISAVTDYAELLDETTTIASKLGDLQGEMDSAQMARFNRITGMWTD